MNNLNRLDVKLPDATHVVPMKLAHMVLKTNRFEAMIDWYVTVLNARIVLKKPHLCFLTYDDEHHRLAICNIPELSNRQRDTCGMDHVAFTYASLGDLLSTYQRLASLGIKPRWPMNHGDTISLYYEDPDGNRIELQTDIFESREALQHYLATDPHFKENPLGAPFDPDEMLANYQNGLALEELVKMPAYPAGAGPLNVLIDMGIIIPAHRPQ